MFHIAWVIDVSKLRFFSLLLFLLQNFQTTCSYRVILKNRAYYHAYIRVIDHGGSDGDIDELPGRSARAREQRRTMPDFKSWSKFYMPLLPRLSTGWFIHHTGTLLWSIGCGFDSCTCLIAHTDRILDYCIPDKLAYCSPFINERIASVVK